MSTDKGKFGRGGPVTLERVQVRVADSRVLDVDERLSRLQVLLLHDRVVRPELDRAVVLLEDTGCGAASASANCEVAEEN